MLLFLSILQYSTIDITNENEADIFSGKISKTPLFVEFYSPWCHHCSDFYPTWQKLVNISELNTKIQFARVDCPQYSKICDKHNINGYPTMVWYNLKENISVRYTGLNQIPFLQNFLERQLKFPIQFIETETDINKYLHKTNRSSIFLLNYNDDNILANFRAIVLDFRATNALFFAYNSTNQSLHVYREKDSYISYEGNWSNNSLAEFINDNINPLLMPFNNDEFEKSEKNGTFVVLFFLNSSQQHYDFTKIVKKLPANYTYCYLENTDDYLAKFMSISKKMVPCIVIMNAKRNIWRVYRGEFRSDLISNWIQLKDVKWLGPGDGRLSDFWIQVYSLKAQSMFIFVFICILLLMAISLIVFVIASLIHDYLSIPLKNE